MQTFGEKSRNLNKWSDFSLKSANVFTFRGEQLFLHNGQGGGQTFYVGGGYDDVDVAEEMDVIKVILGANCALKFQSVF